MTLEAVKSKIAGADAETKPPTLYEQIEGLGAEIARALPGSIDAERFVRNTLTVLRQTPKLAECSWPSIAGALMTAAQVGLEPGPLGHCWLIPRWNRNTGQNEATFQLGWTGILELARRSGRIGTVDGGVVYPGELVEERYGSTSVLDIQVRRPRPTDKGPVAYWVAVEMLDGSRPMFKVMDAAEIVAHADRHAPKDRNGNLAGAWGSDFDAMAVISVFRSMRNWLPLSPELSTALADDPAPVLSPAVPPTRAGESPALDDPGLSARAGVVEGGPFPDGEPFPVDDLPPDGADAAPHPPEQPDEGGPDGRAADEQGEGVTDGAPSSTSGGDLSAAVAPDPDTDRPPLREIKAWADTNGFDLPSSLRSADAACRYLADLLDLTPPDIWTLVTTATPMAAPQEAKP